MLGECGKDMNTVTSVRKVLDWNVQQPEESKQLFSALDSNNRALIDQLEHLTASALLDEDQYIVARRFLAKKKGSEWTQAISSLDASAVPIAEHFLSIRERMIAIRKELKTLGNKAGTPIEPDEMTHILDHTMNNIEGVLCAGCPGGTHRTDFRVLSGVDTNLWPCSGRIRCHLCYRAGRSHFAKIRVRVDGMARDVCYYMLLLLLVAATS